MHASARDLGEGLLGAAGIALDLVTPFLRPVRAHWGLTEEEAAAPHPGDGLVAHPDWSWTHAVDIAVPPLAAWPWVAQVGQEKAGFYSYAVLENLVGCQVENADRVHEEWAQPRVGDGLRLHPDMPPLSLVEVVPGAHMVALGGTEGGPMPRVSWLFQVQPLPAGRCRVKSRFRSRLPASAGARERLVMGPWLTEGVGFVMDRRMLLGIKERAEAAWQG
ncbi:hypothetical protein L6R53_19810 [Myxococcota bacterium]|nr:hypothetical protein [Myxococcota bacterium]